MEFEESLSNLSGDTKIRTLQATKFLTSIGDKIDVTWSSRLSIRDVCNCLNVYHILTVGCIGITTTLMICVNTIIVITYAMYGDLLEALTMRSDLDMCEQTLGGGIQNGDVNAKSICKYEWKSVTISLVIVLTKQIGSHTSCQMQL